MKDDVFLVVTKAGVSRMLKSPKFQLEAGERAVRVVVEVPDDVFEPVPVPTIHLSIPREALTTELQASEELVLPPPPRATR